MPDRKQDSDTKVAVTSFVPPQMPSVRHGRLMPSPGAALPDCPTNLDLTTVQGKMTLYNALNPGDVAFDENGECHITARYYVVYPDEGIDQETGEVSQFNRTVLIDASGQIWRTTSAHAPHRIAAALDLFTAEDWERGIRFQVRERRSKKTGRTYHDIRIVGVG